MLNYHPTTITRYLTPFHLKYFLHCAVCTYTDFFPQITSNVSSSDDLIPVSVEFNQPHKTGQAELTIVPV